ncbi:uncharacterized protein LOC143268441 isoform X2 [Peromyscus maniculatus bairdii]|uniref:uncharacterized protein LOC143268441 isoform X2 n=1 Tax=Peromyscus maniculatus bairdii TaxID=230844 RepID=UPI003FD09978
MLCPDESQHPPGRRAFPDSYPSFSAETRADYHRRREPLLSLEGVPVRRRRRTMVVGCVKMKLNISFPVTGCQKLVEVDEERKIKSITLQQFSSKRCLSPGLPPSQKPLSPLF